MDDRRIQPQPNGMKSRVIARFVDAFPQNDGVKNLNPSRWESQEGFREGLELAAANPNRALLLVKYDIDNESMYKRKVRALARVHAMRRQGYTENNGWVVRAVNDEVYVMFTEE